MTQTNHFFLKFRGYKLGTFRNLIKILSEIKNSNVNSTLSPLLR